MSELIEEYLNAVSSLTISDEIRQKAKIQKLESEKSELQSKQFVIDDLTKRLADFEKILKS